MVLTINNGGYTMQNEIDLYVNLLLKKSEEAYLLALEIVNKPTINYRTEGFAFFMCNAWELLLKAFIIRREQDIASIQFKDDSNRTLGLNDCIKSVFTSTTDKIKPNLHVLSLIRNKSTHLFIPEMDYQWSGLFQLNVSNFNYFFNKHFEFYGLNKKITPYISINKQGQKTLDQIHIREDSKMLLDMVEENISTSEITQYVQLAIIKNKDEADFTVAIDNSNTDSLETKILHVPKDVNSLFPLTFKKLAQGINDTLSLTLNINSFTTRTLTLINKDLNAKKNNRFSYSFTMAGDKSVSSMTKYSIEYQTYIIYKISNDPDFREKYIKKSN